MADMTPSLPRETPAVAPELPPLPEPDLEDVDYELWGQNAKADCFFAEKMRAYAIQAIAADRAAVPDDVERLIHQLRGFASAYPLDMFPEPDHKRAHAALQSVGMTLGEVSASMGRHMAKWTSKAADMIERLGRDRAAVQAAGWREIESAPKDGRTEILLANARGVSQGGWVTDMDCGAEWEGQLGMAGWWRVDQDDSPNTHWMPIPLGPTEEKS